VSTKKTKQKVSTLNSISRADSIELLVDYGINLQKKELELSGEVCDKMYTRLIRGLAVLNQLKVSKLKIVLNTCGGDLYSALGIYDTIVRNETPIDILATGACQSAGALILQAGADRLATPYTQFMIHLGSVLVGGTYKDAQRYMEHCSEVEFQITQIFMERCGWTEDLYNHFHEHDTYMVAKAAKSNNLIDRII
jgi:ATP-dependent Clp protease protease subunit